MALWLFAGADSRGQQSSRGPVHQPVLQSLLPQLLKLHTFQRLNKVSASTQLIKHSSTFISKKKYKFSSRKVCCIQVPQEKAAPATCALPGAAVGGAQAAERQACWTLWAQVCSSSVSECLSGSCSSLDVMVLWTFSRKLLVPAGRGQIFTHQSPPGGATRGSSSHHTGLRGGPSRGSARGSRRGSAAAAEERWEGSYRLEGRSGFSHAAPCCLGVEVQAHTHPACRGGGPSRCCCTGTGPG